MKKILKLLVFFIPITSAVPKKVTLSGTIDSFNSPHTKCIINTTGSALFFQNGIDSQAEIINIANNRSTKITDAVHCVRRLATGLFATAETNKIVLRDDTGKITRTIPAQGVRYIKESSDGIDRDQSIRHLLAVSDEGDISLYNPHNNRRHAHFNTEIGAHVTAAILKDQEVIVATEKKMWDATTYQEIDYYDLRQPSKPAFSIVNNWSERVQHMGFYGSKFLLATDKKLLRSHSHDSGPEDVFFECQHDETIQSFFTDSRGHHVVSTNKKVIEGPDWRDPEDPKKVFRFHAHCLPAYLDSDPFLASTPQLLNADPLVYATNFTYLPGDKGFIKGKGRSFDEKAFITQHYHAVAYNQKTAQVVLEHNTPNQNHLLIATIDDLRNSNV
jgi:thiamine phosphate synthase YjbQ (UPF0047 family)